MLGDSGAESLTAALVHGSSGVSKAETKTGNAESEAGRYPQSGNLSAG